MCQRQQPMRQKVPTAGPGPRGFPDCYYTSHVLTSTYRYVKFVKKLRAAEEEQRKGNEIKLKELKDKQISDFFLRCDRRSLINNVARRVDLCMQSYQEDLKAKRARLIDLLKKEEESDIRKFVIQAQAGAESIWQDKLARLQYLLDKRKKEHEEKYKDVPLDKCTHVRPCIVKIRAKEAQEIQLYQMREKQAKKMAEREFDKMWYDVAMKESDALAARMEVDAMERKRLDLDCANHCEKLRQQNRLQRERDRERLKQEAIAMKAKFDEDTRKDEEAERLRCERSMETGRDRKQMIVDREEALARQTAEAKIVGETWDSLAGQGLADQIRAEKIRKQKERELDECNRQMIVLKENIAKMETADDDMFNEFAQKEQDKIDGKRCQYLLWSQKTNREVRQAIIDQIKDRRDGREALKKKLAEQEEYQRQVFEQMEDLVKNKELEDARARKTHQQNLIKQIEYNQLLKDRALQEEMDQRRKAQIATEEYEREISKMLCRPFFSDDVHPFTMKMHRGLKMPDKCPCSKPDHCALVPAPSSSKK